jgi:flagellin
MTVINTNLNALVASASLNSVDKAMSKAMTELSTGSQLASSANNAAGSAIVNRMTSQVRGLNQAIKNANDGINMLQTIDGSTNTVVDMLQRMRELAVQASTGTNGTNDITNLNAEFKQLRSQISTIATGTTWNSKQVLSSGSTITLQIGPGTSAGGNTMSFNLDKFSVTSTGTTGASTGISLATALSASNATTLMGSLSSALEYVGQAKSDVGAYINRLNYTVDNLTQISTNVSASKSAISDTDYSAASAELSRTQIIKQAATAMLAQANQQPQTVLTLLK